MVVMVFLVVRVSGQLLGSCYGVADVFVWLLGSNVVQVFHALCFCSESDLI